jgi:UrcA family protein
LAVRQHLSIAAVCLLALGASATGAQAGSLSHTTNEVRVSSKGLDLTTEGGAAEYLVRLSRAAASVCGEYPDPSPLAVHASQRFAACRETALAAAVAKSQSELLKRQFAARQADRKVRLAEQ